MFNLKNIIKGFAPFLFIGIANSQQMPQFSQYLRNQFMINPAAAGIYNFTDVTFSGRMQWAGFKNAPMTTYSSITTLIGKEKIRYNPGIRVSVGPVKNPEIKTGKLKHALGAQMIADEYGAFRKIQFAGTYALHLPLTSKVNLSFGVKVGMSNNTFIKNRAMVLNEATDNPYQDFASGTLNKNIMNIGSGLYCYSNKSFIGISADNLTRDMITFGNGLTNFQTKMHFNVMAGHKFQINQNISLTPALLAKYMSPAPVTIEGSLQVEYKQWLWAGISYRNKDAIIGMFGLNISQRFKFGYSYDFSISKFNTYSSGGHELVLGIMLR
ncbi:MAG: type IX secretion system membrane protein PorP/SprF [Flavobacteriia bacterium]|nr:type IX secretion system membrane protein PorP/SprF [Flavobacteriia bacterium]